MQKSEILMLYQLGTRNFSKINNYSESDLSNCYLTDAIFINIYARNTNFKGSQLTGAIFEKATLDCSIMANADLTNATLARARIDSVNFNNAILIGTNFSGARWNSNFPPKMNAQTRIIPEAWEERDFVPTAEQIQQTHARFDGLSRTQIEQLLSGAPKNQTNIILHFFDRQEIIRLKQPIDKNPDRILLNGTGVTYGNLRQTYLYKFNLARSALPEIDLSKQDLLRINLSQSILTGANFHKALVKYANFQSSYLNGANFEDAILDDSILTNADLTNASLARASIDSVNFNNAILIGTNFSGARWDSNFPPKMNAQTRMIPEAWEARDFAPSNKQIQSTKARFLELDDKQRTQLFKGLGPRQRSVLNTIMASEFRIDIATTHDILKYTDQGTVVDTRFLDKNAGQMHIPVIRGDHHGQDLTKQHDSLAGAFIKNANLAGADLHQLNMQGAALVGVDLSGANLAGVNFKDATLVNVILNKADLRRANFDGTRFVNCLLDGVLLDGASLNNVRMQETTVKNIKMNQGVITDLILEQCHVENIEMIAIPGIPLHVNGIGLYDSFLINSVFDGDMGLEQVELSGSVFSADIDEQTLKDSDIAISSLSTFRRQKINVEKDACLGDIKTEIIIATTKEHVVRDPANLINWFWLSAKEFPTLTLVETFTYGNSRDGEKMGEVALADHLRSQKIGYAPPDKNINPTWSHDRPKRPGLIIRG